MTITELVQEFEAEAKTTRRVLERVPSDKLTWAPHTKSMTLGKLAMHLASAPAAISGWPIADQFEFKGDSTPLPTSTDQIVAAHDHGVEQVKANLEKIGDSGLGASWTATAGGKTLMTMPKAGPAARAADESHLPSSRPAVGVPSTARRAGAADLRSERRREPVHVAITCRSLLFRLHRPSRRPASFRIVNSPYEYSHQQWELDDLKST